MKCSEKYIEEIWFILIRKKCGLSWKALDPLLNTTIIALFK